MCLPLSLARRTSKPVLAHWRNWSSANVVHMWGFGERGGEGVDEFEKKTT